MNLQKKPCIITTTTNTSTTLSVTSTSTTTTSTIPVSTSTSSSTTISIATTIAPTTTTTIITTTTTSTTVASTSTTTYALTTTSSTSTVTTTIADAIPPADPSISINPTTPTSGDVTVTITFSGDSAVKQYKIGTGSYQSYTAPFTVSENTIIYAKAQDAVGNWSDEVSYSITNIDKTAPTATVAYSTTAPTNGKVTVTITPSESVTITNNSGLTTYTFTANGSFTFNFTDAVGNTGSATATVNNIDKTTPADPSISINPTTPTSGDVTVAITFSGDSAVKQYKIGTGSYQSYTAPFTISEDTTIYAKAQDSASNWTNEVNYSITNIDKTAPTATVTYSTTAPTNGDVTATITPSESVTITNNDGLTTRTFTSNGSFTFNFIDAAGNTGSVTATVANIDKNAPTATVAYSTTSPTNGNVTATITPSEAVSITNNSGLSTYTFTTNGSFIFYFTDTSGNTGSAIATVNNIDKTAPTATVAYSTTDPTNGDVTATITSSESVTITNNGGSASKLFTANGSFTFEFIDAAGNTGSATATVGNIDKTAPADPSISINPTTPTNGDVTVTITFSGDSAVKQYKIGIGGYQSYTGAFTVSEDTTIYAKAQDSVGNWSGEVNYSITNIDRGDFNVTIILVTPIEALIDFGTYNGTLDKNIGQVLSVSATLDGAASWEWYLDNDILGSTNGNCSIDSSNYDPGPYNLTVFAVKGGLTYSGTIKINIEN